eukprot:5043802-Prymnesium_polylepis.2
MNRRHTITCGSSPRKLAPFIFASARVTAAKNQKQKAANKTARSCGVSCCSRGPSRCPPASSRS